MCHIQRVRRGQAGERGVKSVARKGQGGGGRMGPTWCWPSYFKEPQTARLWSARAPCGCSSWLPGGGGHSASGTPCFDTCPWTAFPLLCSKTPSPTRAPLGHCLRSLTLSRLHSTDGAKQCLGPQSTQDKPLHPVLPELMVKTPQ